MSAVVVLCLPAAATAETVTIGPEVHQLTSNSGTCGFEHASERPCAIVTNSVPGATMTSPCDGTVTRFRLKGFVRPANHYSLRVIRKNPDGSYTGTATSAPVAIATEGVNEYATDLPISAGEQIGIDFLDSTEEYGLAWIGGPTVSASVLFAFPADGTAAFPDIPSTTFYYLFNADVSCTPPPPPSNSFRVVKLKKTTLVLDLASAGSLRAVDASHSKSKPRLLKGSRASGGPGRVKLKLKLTSAAKATLREKGKLALRTKLVFTPTGGVAATRVRKLTIRG
ncbi:MAG TPA: hypothetical protein VMT37_04560 [Solirubrobacterales bacterium]|nr:hypothetical protein [Solirubrobacterales bacterium]